MVATFLFLLVSGALNYQLMLASLVNSGTLNHVEAPKTAVPHVCSKGESDFIFIVFDFTALKNHINSLVEKTFVGDSSLV